MIDIITSIATVFVIILLGWLLRVKSVPSEAYWVYADKLVYWILFPSFLFYRISSVEISGELLQPIFSTLIVGMVVCVLLAWAGARVFGFNLPATSSIVQASGRQNTFISLAIAERLFGDSGLLIATLATALLVPVTNIVIVISLVIILNKGQQQLLRKIGSDLVRNPILISIALGFAANTLGWRHIIVVHEVTALLGSATLPIVLLCIGASMKFEELGKTLNALLLSSLIKFVFFPGFAIFMMLQTSLPAEITIILCIFTASPTASSGFALARQMGGDYRLMASLITQQTMIAFITLPLTIYLVMKLQEIV